MIRGPVEISEVAAQLLYETAKRRSLAEVVRDIAWSCAEYAIQEGYPRIYYGAAGSFADVASELNYAASRYGSPHERPKLYRR